MEIAQENDLLDDDRVKMFKIKKSSLWGGAPRNTGILKATGDYIIYLDADDEYTSTYLYDLALEIIPDEKSWYIVDDLVYDKKDGYVVREANIKKRGSCGTSNIIHSPKLNVLWADKGNYAHDFVFINILKAKNASHKKLTSVGYVVQHIPGLYDK